MGWMSPSAVRSCSTARQACWGTWLSSACSEWGALGLARGGEGELLREAGRGRLRPLRGCVACEGCEGGRGEEETVAVGGGQGGPVAKGAEEVL